MEKRIRIILLSLFSIVLAVLVFSWQNQVARGDNGCDSIVDPSAKADCEDTNNAIDKTQNKIDKTQKVLQTSKTLLTQKQIEANKTQSLIQQTQSEITRKEAEVDNLNKNIELDRKILESYIRELYMEDQSVPLIRIVVSDQNASDIYGDFDNLISSKQKVIEKIQEIQNSKEEVAKTKEVLADKKDENAKLLAVQKNQQVSIKADISDSMATLEELQKKLVELQGDLLVVTGTSYSAKNIQDAVDFASGKTGVPKGVLYGFLKMETNLGANTGQCTYAEVEKVSVARYNKYGSKYKASIALLYKRRDLFYDIVKSLGYSKDKKVSCSPNYIGQGGAMGVSQFMSDVWNNYSSQITSQTGHGKPNPWDLTDGVMALALKLKKAGATSDSAATIRNASINYLGAFNNNYYSGIVYWAKNYKTLFD